MLRAFYPFWLFSDFLAAVGLLSTLGGLSVYTYLAARGLRQPPTREFTPSWLNLRSLSGVAKCLMCVGILVQVTCFCFRIWLEAISP
jgi:hypothetical protein